VKVFPYRWLLPFGHLLIDTILLLSWIASLPTPRHGTYFPRNPTVSPVLLQEGVVEFDPHDIPPHPVFMFLGSGNLPALAVSANVRPDLRLSNRKWDPVWFVIHEFVSLPIWLFIGEWCNSGKPRARRVMMIFLISRFALAGIIFTRIVSHLTGVMNLAEIGIRGQALFWLAMILYFFTIGIKSLWLRLQRSPSVQ
jgi:hypothetical protein